ncbi:SRPBCC family protein [Lysinibacillus sp. ZYM-1]|uniref:SRPBCC family protein n=1 Tax=Lysinibacillus sp. ZYM-1 TaxID=1681184 RepID=UPI0006CE9AB5|nr:SRPBCC family protein [Lysinibacillus sp. ZYM-1]KPN95908.1 activator of Hsp90 ATPase 1 family protein [Lysinibacillus sp. ZYM-1]
MLATIEKQSNRHVAKFKRPLPHSVDAVWAAITNNEMLQKWMSNLEILDLRKNGKMHFNMNDGTDAYEKIDITDYAENEVLEFDWGRDTVRFELSSTDKGTLLLLVETLQELTEHTPKDLAGWHICLDLLTDLLDGIEQQSFPMDAWQQRFYEYKELVDTVK